MTVDIRRITEHSDYRKLEELQRVIWNMDDVDVIPGRTMHAIDYNGGVLLGAFDDDELVGFVFGVLGTVQGLEKRIDQVAAARLQMYSTIMGVHPAYQRQGLGYQLKLAQREAALRLGIRLITWTYDPLESRNGWLNIGKLGAVSHRYLRDFHGPQGGINAGLTTDRFYVEWWVTGNRVQSRVVRRRRPLSYDQLIAGRAILINEATFNDQGLPVPPPTFAESDRNLIIVEIPSNIQEIKHKDMDLARQWRAHTRVLFEHYFEHQFIVTDFARRTGEQGRERSYYVLTYQHA
ncbi:MAG TPA: GNAT family N-acetyltransferase [Candidatus Sulfomarinibacteraceae bacterium]|nr:GNAT family N-acetyltransferase [Candidatus Sulfomarinibacteraceae bacterium]